MAELNLDYLDLNLHSDSDVTKELNIIENPLELFLQEIELAVKIAPGEIWGIYDSINIQRYVFNQYVTLTQVKNEIKTYIENNCSQANNFPWTIDTQFVNIDNQNLLYIIFTVSRVNDLGISENFKVNFLLGNKIDVTS